MVIAAPTVRRLAGLDEEGLAFGHLETQYCRNRAYQASPRRAQPLARLLAAAPVISDQLTSIATVGRALRTSPATTARTLPGDRRQADHGETRRHAGPDSQQPPAAASTTRTVGVYRCA